MKRHGYLFEQAFSFENLHQSFLKAYKGSHKKGTVAAFAFHAETRLWELHSQLHEGKYQPSPYRYFEIHDPKRRLISVAPFVDRVVHHAVVSVLEPIFEPMFIEHSFATRKNKGQHKAVKQAQSFLKKHKWYLKSDISGYFYHIDQKILLHQLERKVKDRRFLRVVEQIIQNGGQDGKGLPIGNLTSQFFANVYLNQFDHWVRNHLKLPQYIRYMDDFVIFDDNKQTLKTALASIMGYLQNHLQLKLNLSHTYLNQRLNGLSFLGARIYPKTVRVHPANARRTLVKVQQKRQAYKRGELDEEAWLQSLNSHWAWLESFDSLGFRKKYVALNG